MFHSDLIDRYKKLFFPTTKRIEIKFDVATREISVGKWSADKIYFNCLLEDNLDLKVQILKANGIKLKAAVDQTASKKEYHKEIAGYLGPQFYKRLSAISNLIWIKPIEDEFKKYCWYFSGYRRAFFFDIQVKRAWEIRPLLRQLSADNLEHLAPIYIFFMEEPATLKKRLGKGIWKKLANNSLSFNRTIIRNLLIMKSFSDSSRLTKMFSEQIDEAKTLLTFQLSLKRTLVWRFCTYFDYDDAHELENFISMMKWVSSQKGISNKQYVLSLFDTYSDSQRMAEQMSVPFCVKKLNSEEKMYRFHRELNRQISERNKKLSVAYHDKIDAAMRWLVPYKKFLEEKLSGSVSDHWKIKFIHTNRDLIREGDEMEHCVASYADLIGCRHYIVLSLQMKERSCRTTLGLEVIGNRIKIDQHYCRDNNPVFDAPFQQMAKTIEEILNRAHQALSSHSELQHR